MLTPLQVRSIEIRSTSETKLASHQGTTLLLQLLLLYYYRTTLLHCCLYGTSYKYHTLGGRRRVWLLPSRRGGESHFVASGACTDRLCMGSVGTHGVVDCCCVCNKKNSTRPAGTCIMAARWTDGKCCPCVFVIGTLQQQLVAKG